MQMVDASVPFFEMGIPNPVTLYRKVLDGFGVTDTTEYISPQAQQAGQAPPPQPEAPQPPQGQPAGPPPGAEMGPPPGMPPGMPPEAGIGNPIQEGGIPPEILELLPPEIIEGIMSGAIPPEMIQQIMMEMEASAPAGGGMMPPMA